MAMFKLGFVINPVAGVGGSVALKGSDNVVEQALALGATAKANERAKTALSVLLPYQHNITIYCAEQLMGELCAKQLGFTTEVVYRLPKKTSTESKAQLQLQSADNNHRLDVTSSVENNSSTDNLLVSQALDTQKTITALLSQGVDLILFAGGDGTARDISSVVNNTVPVLGIPAGCKIHSGVYAVTPIAAGRVVEMMLKNQIVSLQQADVMDIDESLFRDGVVKAKRYCEMLIPQELQYVQAVKSGGKESDELVLQDIAAYVIDQMDSHLMVMGSGSTTAFIMEELALEHTLLGVDVIQHEQLIAQDLTEQALWQLIETHGNDKNTIEQEPENAKLVITLIGGQGHIFGRGNQQLSPRIIRAIGAENIIVVATKSKLAELNNKPLLVDTGDIALDEELAGFISIITGYNDHVLYPVACLS